MSYQYEAESQSDLVVDVPGRGQVSIELKWKTIHGRAEVMAMTVTSLDDTTPLEPVVLRSIPLATIIKQERPKSPPTQTTPPKPTQRTRGSRRPLSDDDLRHVAALYMVAWQQGLPVQKYVAEQRGIALPTATRQILLARKRGFINESINPKRSKK